MEPQQARVDPGASVEATDGHVGTVDEIIVRPNTGELVYLTVRRGWNDQLLTIPVELIEAIPSRREVRLRVTRDQARAQATDVPSEALLASDRGNQLRIPVVEERLVPGKRQVDLGELRIHKHVDHVEETVGQSVTRDDLVIERVPVGRPLTEPLEPRVDGDWLVIPIMEEVLVVQKRLMLAEEVRIRKRQLTVDQEVREVVRHERVELEDATVYGVDGLRAADATTQLSVDDPRAADATTRLDVARDDSPASDGSEPPPPPPTPPPASPRAGYTIRPAARGKER